MHVMYAKLTCTYLAKALNDTGPEWFVTRPMLMLHLKLLVNHSNKNPVQGI